MISPVLFSYLADTLSMERLPQFGQIHLQLEPTPHLLNTTGRCSKTERLAVGGGSASRLSLGGGGTHDPALEDYDSNSCSARSMMNLSRLGWIYSQGEWCW